MFKLIITLVFATFASSALFAQSVETFYGIKLEDETSNQAIELRPPTLTSGYTMTLPSSMPTLAIGQTRALTVTGASTGLVWATIPLITGTTPGVAYFKTNEEVSSSTDFLWDETTRTLTLANGSTSNALLALLKSGTPGANHSAMTLTNTAQNASLSILTKRGLAVSSTGAWTGVNVGLEVAVSGGTRNYAATFTGGRVGVGTSSPGTALEITGDLAYTEYSFTTALAASNHNMDFDGAGNNFSLIRIGPQASPYMFTGFAGGVAGKTMTILNASGQPLTIASASASSTSTNRFITPGNDAIVIPSQSTVSFHYSGVESRWFVGAVSPLNFTGYPLTIADVGASSVLPTATASYVKVTNNDVNKNITLEDGVAVGQVLIIQNNTTSCCYIRVTGANTEVASADATIQPAQALFMVWDGAKWQTVSAKS
ncbi:MAG: hypothetical protein H7X70_06675 [Candidatus Kapabacteria bacterium]|nr:hypothetical protein [Candidatus Kapabacteria bacterium]